MADKAFDKMQLHKEHRIRVKERFLRDGLSGFAPHEILELLLFFAIPQRDTNELAHRLLLRFGSLSGVFHASAEELAAVDGMGMHAATLLCLLLPTAARAREEEKQEKRQEFHRLKTVGDFFVDLFSGVRQETVYLLLLDNAYRRLDCVKIYEGSVNSVAITPRLLIEHAFRTKAAMAVLAHNHPQGIAIPSAEDVQTTLQLRQAFAAVGVTLLEHILVAGGSYTPILLRSAAFPGAGEGGTYRLQSGASLLAEEDDA